MVLYTSLWCSLISCGVLCFGVLWHMWKKKDETLRSRCISMIREQKKLKEVLKVNDKWNNFILTGFQDMGHVPAENDLAYLEERFTFEEPLSTPAPSAFVDAINVLLPDG